MPKVKYNSVVPFFTRCGTGYGASVTWKYLEENLNRWKQYEEEIPGSGLVLEPDYQREHVWTEEQQIAYLEYIMRGGVSGKDIYWNCSSWGGNYNTPIELVDGKQRIQSVRKFMADELKVFGKYVASDFDHLDESCCCFTFKMNNLRTKKQVMQWYVEFNTGGTVHSEAEIERVKKLIGASK